MKFRNIIGGMTAFLLSTSMVCMVSANPVIDNANKDADYFVETSSMLPQGCKIEDAAYVAFKFTGYTPNTVINGALAFNTEKGGWNSMKWGSDEKAEGNDDVTLPFAVGDYQNAGAEIEIVRPINHDFDNPGGWSQVAIQYYYSTDNAPINIKDVYFLDSNKQRLAAKAASTDAPVTEAAPAATTAATTKSAAATTTAKPSTNPSTGDPGVATAVAAAMAAAGVAVVFRRKKSEK